MRNKIWYLLSLLTLVFIPSAFAFEPITMTAALAGLTAAAGTAGVGAGLWGLFGGGKKKSQDVPDPLAGLRAQLQGLAAQVPGQVAKQKELTASQMATAKTEGLQGINENIRAERGFGNTSLQDRLNTELYDKLLKTQTEADLASDIWGTQQQASILGQTAGMYPGVAAEEQPSWQSQLLGQGANMLVQDYINTNKWDKIAKAFGNKGAISSSDDDWLRKGAYAEMLNPTSSITTLRS